MISQAFILAGGKGERLRPLTENIPKPMILIKGKPILEWILINLAEYGIKEIILSVGFKHEKIMNYFGKEFKGIKIDYAIEKEFLGTGGALKFSEKKLKEKFFMLNGDNLADLNFKKMEEEHNSSKCFASIALIEVENPEAFGIAKLNEKKIIEFIEKPLKENAPSNLANAGVYIIEKKSLEFLPEGFNLIEKTLFPKLAEMNLLNSFKHKGQWFATDTKEKLLHAEKNFNPFSSI
jgi:mannose-1-phosphate guanylyltransferase